MLHFALFVTSQQTPVAITGYDVSPVGSRVAVVTSENSVQIVGLEDERPSRTLGVHGDRVYCIGFSPDGKRLASASSDGKTRIFDVETANEIASFPAFSGGGSCMRTGAYATWSKDGARLLTYGQGKDAVLLDVFERKQIRSLGDDNGIVEVAFWGPDSSLIVTSTDRRAGRLWDGVTGEPRSDSVRLPTIEVQGLALSPDGRRLAVGCKDARARIVDVSTGKVELTVSHKDMDLFGDLSVGGVSFSHDGKHLLTTDRFLEVRSWNATNGREEWRNGAEGGTEGWTSAGYSPDEREVFVNSRWIDAESGRTKRQLPRSGRFFYSLSTDGRFVSWIQDGELVVRDAANLEERYRISLSADRKATVRRI